jgi:hypothetical protein
MGRLLTVVFLFVLAGACYGVEGPFPLTEGPFSPNWESLQRYQFPEWFRDAKFGIWAHWSAQCVPEQGDWYARGMYQEGSGQYNYHVEHYGHPSQFGFRWAAAALLETEKRFRKVMDHKDLWMLKAVLDEETITRQEVTAA